MESYQFDRQRLIDVYVTYSARTHAVGLEQLQQATEARPCYISYQGDTIPAWCIRTNAHAGQCIVLNPDITPSLMKTLIEVGATPKMRYAWVNVKLEDIEFVGVVE